MACLLTLSPDCRRVYFSSEVNDARTDFVVSIRLICRRLILRTSAGVTSQITTRDQHTHTGRMQRNTTVLNDQINFLSNANNAPVMQPNEQRRVLQWTELSLGCLLHDHLAARARTRLDHRALVMPSFLFDQHVRRHQQEENDSAQRSV